MNILNRIGKIIEANIKTSFAIPLRKKRLETSDSDAGQTNSRNQKAKTASNLRDKKLENAYAALEIPYGSDLQTTKSAWKKLVKRYHPDLYSNDSEKARIAHKVTQGLNDAFHTIEQTFKKIY